MESLIKSRIQGVWDPAHSTRVGIPSDCGHFPPGCIKSGILLPPPFHPDVSHPEFYCHHFPPGCITYGILLPPPFHPDVSHPEFCHRRHSIRMSYIRNSRAGWERRAFQLLRIYISESSNSVHPENFAAIFCTVAWCSPEASRYV